MRRVLFAILAGVAVGYLLMRLWQRRFLFEELSEETEPDVGVGPAPGP